MAMAKPTVIGRTGLDLGFVHRSNCLLVHQADPEALAREIRWAFENASELTEIGRKGLALYHQEFSVKKKRDRLNCIVQEMLNGNLTETGYSTTSSMR
jgi:glycosyltransferase involved in cell wall biosynthesis